MAVSRIHSEDAGDCSPPGPLTWTLDAGCVRLITTVGDSGGGGSKTWNETLEGTDKGACPILDAHLGVDEKALWHGDGHEFDDGTKKAGKRKVGTEAVYVAEETMLRRHLWASIEYWRTFDITDVWMWM